MSQSIPETVERMAIPPAAPLICSDVACLFDHAANLGRVKRHYWPRAAFSAWLQAVSVFEDHKLTCPHFQPNE